MARSILSFGMFSFLPARIAVRRRGLELGSRPPMRAAMVISRMTRVKTRPRLASVAAFLCLIVAHFECPDMRHPLFSFATAKASHRADGCQTVKFCDFRRPVAIFREPVARNSRCGDLR